MNSLSPSPDHLALPGGPTVPPPASGPTVREQAERLLGVLRHSLRFWATGLLLFVLGVGASVAVAVHKPRTYRSEALILYRERVSASALGREEANDSARRIGMRLRELVLSRSRLEGIAEAVDQMRTQVGFKAREGDTYALSFEGPDPRVAQLVAQKLTDALMAENERSTVEVAAGTKEFLDSEAKRVEDELKVRESRLAKFLSEHPAFAAEAARGGGTNISAMPEGAKRAEATVRRHSDPRSEALEREADRIRARLNPTPPSPSAPTPEVKEAQERWNRKKEEAARELDAAQRDLADKRQSFTDEHPDVKRAKARVEAALRAVNETQLDSMRELARMSGRPQPVVQPLTPDERQKLQDELARLQSEIARVRASSRTSDADAQAQAQAKAKSAAASEADAIVRLETTWVQLTREVADAQEQRRQVEAKRFTADIRDRLAQTEGGARMVVIDPPYKPTRPTKGGRTQAVVLGSLGALLAAFLLMILRALVDDRIYDRYGLESLGLAPILTVIPVADPATRRRERRAERAADHSLRKER